MSKRPLDLAMKWMELFFQGENFTALESILTPTCIFNGPYASYNSAQAYIHTLSRDPPGECSYEILDTVESTNAVVLIYRFDKPGASSVISQFFRIDEGLISEIRLVFDSADF